MTRQAISHSALVLPERLAVAWAGKSNGPTYDAPATTAPPGCTAVLALQVSNDASPTPTKIVTAPSCP